MDERIDRLHEHASETMEMILSKENEEELGPILSLLDDLEDVVDEAEDVLSTVDLTQLSSTLDWDDLPEALEIEDLPDAIAEGDASEAVTLRKLIDLVDLSKLWGSVDARELWRQKREFDEEIDDLTDDRGLEDDDGAGDDGDRLEVSVRGTGFHDVDPQSIENAIQSEVSDSVGEFRRKLLEAHDRLAAVRERNEDRFPDRRRERSRNPTAVSTLPTDRSAGKGVAGHSTVPEETRYSTAPNRPRVYGTRFETAGGDDDE